ncbi:bifunctional CS domain/NudC family/HSP20-like chaperone [Babesia duncani]|uniref:Bifunctional CS domain/NudC family/HSP20-like chaperone n=1 Tax=Babesia duncani TaxID=323732 RepID=A0AAD9UPX3_9APIC|nr:bifunctional CS domain/NudC family/HSP20-like chaperone [Babesia duncani]
MVRRVKLMIVSDCGGGGVGTSACAVCFYLFSGGMSYSWEQSFDGVTLSIGIPPGTTKFDVSINFSPNTLDVEIANRGTESPIKFGGQLFSNIDTCESTWTLEKDSCQIYLYKAKPGEVWGFLFKGQEALDPMKLENDRKRLLLERFQLEHPSFDFSDAEINGRIPEPRTFMK